MHPKAQKLLDSKGIVHRIASKDTRRDPAQLYELKLIEREIQKDYENVFLLIPGFFQNPLLFDILPEKGISFSRFLEDEFRAKVYWGCIRGIGGSDYPRQSNMDDIIIDDYTAFFDFLASREKGKKIIPLGHSQGAITLQGYFSGLSRKNGHEYFDSECAKARSKQVHSVGLLAGSVSMKTIKGDNSLLNLSSLDRYFSPLVKLIDRLPAQVLTQWISPVDKKLFGFFSGKHSLAYSKIWNFHLEVENISKEVLKNIYDLTLEHSSGAILNQFAQGVQEESIKTRNGHEYLRYLRYIQGPISQLTFEKDSMAYPDLTFESSFRFIGSPQKKFFSLKGLGHEDLFLRRDYFELAYPFLDSLI